MKVFFGSSISDHQRLQFENSEIGLDISKNLAIDTFSDGEILPLFKSSVRDEDVYLIQSLYTHDSIFETILIIDAAKRAGCQSFTLVAPYLAYSRQDKADHLRSSIGSKSLAVMLESVGLNKLITIDLHNSAITGFYEVPVIHLNGNKIFLDYINSLNIPDLCIVAPDQGAVKRASDFCKAFPQATFAMINKKRIKPNEIHSMELVGEVKNKNVIIVDDMVDTGKTLSKSADLILENGALSVRSVATHGVLSGVAIEVLQNSQIKEILVSDTISSCFEKSNFLSKMTIVSCSDLVSKSIRALTLKKSINLINAI